MKYREITHLFRIPDDHPYVVVAGIHPSLWTQLCKFVERSPDQFCLLAKLEPQPDEWTVYIGCSSTDARSQFDVAWG